MLISPELDAEFKSELSFVRTLPIQGFPSLVLIHEDRAYPIEVNYTEWRDSFSQINSILN